MLEVLSRASWAVASSFFKGKIPPLATSVYTSTVYPCDLDFFFHMNHSRYLFSLNFSRAQHFAQSGVGAALLRERATHCVAANCSVAYYRPLNLFQPYEIDTRVLGWTEDRMVFEEVIRPRERKTKGGEENDVKEPSLNRPSCTSIVTYAFRKGRTPITPDTLIERMNGGEAMESPTLPEFVETLLKGWEQQRNLARDIRDSP